MCNSIDSNIVILAEDAINELTDSGEMFTAYDVTSILRKRNIPNLPKHYELKEVVHEMFKAYRMNRDYIRTMRIVDANQPSAFVYHRFDADPAQYDPAIYAPATVTAPVQSHVGTTYSPPNVQQMIQNLTPSGSISNRNTNLKNNTVVADARGRIHVPKKYLDAISVEKYQYAFVQKNESIIQIFKNKTPNITKCTAMSADVYGNMKIAVGRQNAGKVYSFVANPTAKQITIS